MTAAPNENGLGALTPRPDHVADNADIEAICSSDIGVKAAETQALSLNLLDPYGESDERCRLSFFTEATLVRS